MQKSAKTKNVLDTDKIGGLLFKLSMPVFLGMFVQTLYNVISTIFIGRFVGPIGIAALSISFPLQMMGYGLGTMSGIGGMSVISRSLGAGRDDDAEKALGNGFTLAILLSCFVIAILLPFLDFWLKLIGASETVLPYAREYMIYITISYIFMVLSISLLNYTRAEGNANVSMGAMIIGSIVDISLCFVFIVWMKMEVKGAGLATLFAQLCSVLYLLNYYRSGRSYLKVRWHNFKPDLKIMKEMLAIGIGAFVQMFAGSFSAMVLLKMVVTYGGDYALGAFGIAQRIMMFVMMPAMVLSQGAQPILGFNYGAGRFRLALKSITLAIGFSMVLCSAGFLIVYFIPEPIIRIFNDNPQLISIGVEANKRMFLAQPLLGPLMVGTMIFQAVGKAKQAFVAAIGRPLLFVIPAALTLTHFMGLKGVWLAFPTSDLLTFLLVMVLMIPILKEFKQGAALEKNEVALTESHGF